LRVSESTGTTASSARADGAINNDPSMSKEDAITLVLCLDLPRGCVVTAVSLFIVFFHFSGAAPARSCWQTPVLLLLELQLGGQTRILSLQSLTAVSSAALSEMPTYQNW